MPDYRTYATAILQAAGLPSTRANVDFMANVWMPSENTKAGFNPLATTTHRPGSTDFNRNGGFPVQNFKSYADGISATAQTLLNGHYGSILTLMKRGNANAADLARAVQQSPWGTKQGLIGKLAGGGKSTTEFSSGKAASPIYGTNEVDQGAAANPFSRRVALAQASLGQAQRTLAGNTSTSQWLNDIAAAVALPQEIDANTTGGTVVPPISRATGQVMQATNATAQRVLQIAHGQIGKPYVFGSGPDTSSFDCSDLIQYAYKQVGINLPRVTGDQIKYGEPVAWGKFKPGDLIFSHGGGHVVMYVGDGKVIAAPHTGTVVQYQSVNRFRSGFTAARRIIK